MLFVLIVSRASGQVLCSTTPLYRLGQCPSCGLTDRSPLPRAPQVLISTDPQLMASLEKEVAVLAGIRHPHIVALKGSCLEAQALVYEYLPGGSLQVGPDTDVVMAPIHDW
jgi:serine/threonine protein kinase